MTSGDASTSWVSVVIPTYNRRLLLERAIKSIQAQSSSSIRQIIVVDDGSTDDTRARVEQMAASDRRILLITREREGANRARNAGIAAATGDLIAFLDSDDEWEPHKIARQEKQLMASPDAVASFTGFRSVGGEDAYIFLPPLDPDLILLLSANVMNSTSTAIVRASALKEAGNFDPDLRSCQDWDLWVRLRRIGRFAVLREPLVRFNTGPHDRISTSVDSVLMGHAVVFKRFREGLSAIDDCRVEAGHRLVRAEINLRTGDPRSALVLSIKSLARRPSKWGVHVLYKSLRKSLVVKKRRVLG